LRQKEEMNEASLINTLLQRGAVTTNGCQNRFNGFSRGMKTVETVSDCRLTLDTQLKQGVNENRATTPHASTL
jgi:hypothetical protein